MPADWWPGTEELAGPLTVIKPVDTGEELWERLNSGPGGLAAYVWGEPTAARETARKLRFGSVGINRPIARDARVPFGGFRMSGVERVGGTGWLDFWSETRSMTL